jgi:hypothetical protein
MGSTKYDSAVSNPLISGFVSGNPNTKYESSLGPVPLLALASPTVREPVSSEHDEPFNFRDLHRDLEGIETSMIVRAWSACLGIAALLDFSAAMVRHSCLIQSCARKGKPRIRWKYYLETELLTKWWNFSKRTRLPLE